MPSLKDKKIQLKKKVKGFAGIHCLDKVSLCEGEAVESEQQGVIA
jgi:hypothetical protein